MYMCMYPQKKSYVYVCIYAHKYLFLLYIVLTKTSKASPTRSAKTPLVILTAWSRQFIQSNVVHQTSADWSAHLNSRIPNQKESCGTFADVRTLAIVGVRHPGPTKLRRSPHICTDSHGFRVKSRLPPTGFALTITAIFHIFWHICLFTATMEPKEVLTEMFSPEPKDTLVVATHEINTATHTACLRK